MGLINLVLIALALFVAYQAIKLIAWSNRKKAMRAAIASLPTFICSRSHVGDGGHDGIAIDEAQGVLYVLGRSRGRVNSYRIDAADIVGAEVTEESTARTTQSGGSVVVIVGRIGVPVGGPRYKTRHYISRVALKIGVRDPSLPMYTVTFLAAECKRNGIAHLFYAEQAKRWQAHIRSLAAAHVRLVPVPTLPPSFSVADELRKLASLKGDGLLTDQEFERQRSKLLAS